MRPPLEVTQLRRGAVGVCRGGGDALSDERRGVGGQEALDVVVAQVDADPTVGVLDVLERRQQLPDGVRSFQTSSVFSSHTHRYVASAKLASNCCTFLPSKPTSASGLSDMLPLQCGTIFHLLSGNQAQ